MEVKTNSYQNLMVWQKSMDFAVKVYETTKKFPSEEKFGLVSQINKAAVSIPSNIAEGAGRDSKKEFSQFLSIALGSTFEAQTQLILAHRIGFISNDALESLSQTALEIQKMVFGLRKSIISKLT